ncbi:vacuolar protein sorting-associated protein 33A-like [Watersipora subatra]|uniref:vacuolar protein sorting-associated protein 33A-like n=1 Tax=Watersipora subatra TaxID=2589382 RepID=UPI00355B5975
MASDFCRIKLSELKDFYRFELFSFLEECEGPKALIWDDDLTGPISSLCELGELKSRDVARMYSLTIEDLPVNTIEENYRHIIFLVRPNIRKMDKLALLVSRSDRYSSRNAARQFHILFMPNESEACCRKLKELNVFGSFSSIESLGVYLLPLDTDLLSMNNPHFVKNCFMDSDFSALHDVASSIMTIQSIYGIIPNVYCKGECSKRVLNMMTRMRREKAGTEEQITPQIDNLIMLDRTVDLLTPFLSQLTYQGFIDELFQMQLNAIQVPADRLPSSAEQTSSDPNDKKKVVLTSSDKLFAELRDKNFNAIGPILSTKAKAVSAKYEERNHAKTIGELKQFVSQLPVMQSERQSITTNTAIAQMIKEYIATESFKDGLLCQQELRSGLDVDKANVYIEDCISRMEPLHKVLRLISIQSFCGGGLKPNVLQLYKTAIVQVYGYQSIILLNNMEKVGLIKIQRTNSKVYPALRKSLNLLVEDINEQNPSDIAYVYSGYAPISIRLVQNALKPGWRNFTSSLPGEAIEEIQQLPDGVRKRRGSITSSTSLQADRKVTLVYFLGGITFAEIAALRFLQQEDHPTEYLIAATHITNGDSFINSLDTLSHGL